MIAYHNDPTIKQKYLNRVQKHRKADQLLQGYGYWNDGKGCAVGCTIHGSCHKDYESELGIPEHIAYLEDVIFEGLPVESAKLWPEKFLSAIQPGADLSLVWPKWTLWMLTNLGKLPIDKSIQEVITNTAKLFQRWVEGNKPEPKEWKEAAKSAAEAAEAAWAKSAAWAAEKAAWAAKSAAWEKMSEKLLELLKNAPITIVKGQTI